jgi:5,10-methenyltetrahydrofolate synthetase
MNPIPPRETLRCEMRATLRTISEPDRALAERCVAGQFLKMVADSGAATVFFYINVRTELPTTVLRTPEMLRKWRIVIPYCVGSSLQLFHLTSPDELIPGRFGIPEPRMELRDDPHRRVAPTEPDVFLIPGLAFDAACRRLGQGGGFFDRFLPTIRPDARRIGAAFDEQIIPCVPTASHDQPLDTVLTPTRQFHRTDAGK